MNVKISPITIYASDILEELEKEFTFNDDQDFVWDEFGEEILANLKLKPKTSHDYYEYNLPSTGKTIDAFFKRLIKKANKKENIFGHYDAKVKSENEYEPFSEKHYPLAYKLLINFFKNQYLDNVYNQSTKLALSSFFQSLGI